MKQCHLAPRLNRLLDHKLCLKTLVHSLSFLAHLQNLHSGGRLFQTFVNKIKNLYF